jgi:6-phosphogluconate dehydrogenase
MILMMVPAGAPVTEQIDALSPLLARRGYPDRWRQLRLGRQPGSRDSLAKDGLRFLGLGVSGGAEGARHGPSMMAGGHEGAWDAAAPILTSIAARFEDSPCAAYFGAGGAGHYVKTVHNGIEYADMQMIAEIYGLMRDGQGRDAADIGALFARWNAGPLESYLIEIAARGRGHDRSRHRRSDSRCHRRPRGAEGHRALDRDRRADPRGPPACGRGRGHRPRPVGRGRSSGQGRDAVPGAGTLGPLDDADLEAALLVGKILAYSQGFTLLARARVEEDWTMPLDAVAETWRAGCIIRSAMLDDMASALANASDDQPLAFAPGFVAKIEANLSALRRVIAAATLAGLPVPALSAALQHFDQLRQARGTANMIQGLRDRFGTHGFERIDRPGETGLHGPWVG